MIRADAGRQIGIGHLMRCMALGKAWQDAGGDVIFLTAPDVGTKNILREKGIESLGLASIPGSIEDALETAEAAGKAGADWVVADGYHFHSEYQKIIKDSGMNLLMVDDHRFCDRFYADIILNQNLHACKYIYSHTEPYTRFLLGPSYILIRKEFERWRDWKREIPDRAEKILITMGGSDPDNVTSKALDALCLLEAPGVKSRIIIGPANPHHEMILKRIRDDARHIPEVSGPTPDISRQMAWADLAISAAGSTCWELAYMGLPSIILVLADNQEPIAAALDQSGISLNLGRHSQVSASKIASSLSGLIHSREIRSGMSSRGRNLIDGLGAKRVASVLMDGGLERTGELEGVFDKNSEDGNADHLSCK